MRSGRLPERSWPRRAIHSASARAATVLQSAPRVIAAAWLSPRVRTSVSCGFGCRWTGPRRLLRSPGLPRGKSGENPALTRNGVRGDPGRRASPIARGWRDPLTARRGLREGTERPARSSGLSPRSRLTRRPQVKDRRSCSDVREPAPAVARVQGAILAGYPNPFCCSGCCSCSEFPSCAASVSARPGSAQGTCSGSCGPGSPAGPCTPAMPPRTPSSGRSGCRGSSSRPSSGPGCRPSAWPFRPWSATRSPIRSCSASPRAPRSAPTP